MSTFLWILTAIFASALFIYALKLPQDKKQK